MSTEFQWATALSRIVVISVGVIGNALSFIIYSRKTFQNNSISTYCRALAIFDCLIIMQLINDAFYVRDLTIFYFISDATCKLFFYVSMLFSAIPGWILVAFSLDKMLNMRTSTPKVLKSKLFQWSVIAGIVIFHMLFYSVLLVILKLEPLFFMPEIKICNMGSFDYFNIFVYAQIAQSGVVPFLIMIITSIITIRLLKKSRGSLEKMGHADKKRRARDIKFTITSLAFNVFFIAFKLPFLIYPLLPLNEIFFTFLNSTLLIYIVNCSSNFFIHFATNSIFRRECFVIFRINMFLEGNRVSSTGTGTGSIKGATLKTLNRNVLTSKITANDA